MKDIYVELIVTLGLAVLFVTQIGFTTIATSERPNESGVSKWAVVEEAKRIGDECDAYVKAYLEDYYGLSQQ